MKLTKYIEPTLEDYLETPALQKKAEKLTDHAEFFNTTPRQILIEEIGALFKKILEEEHRETIEGERGFLATEKLILELGKIEEAKVKLDDQARLLFSGDSVDVEKLKEIISELKELHDRLRDSSRSTTLLFHRLHGEGQWIARFLREARGKIYRDSEVSIELLRAMHTAQIIADALDIRDRISQLTEAESE